MTASVKLLRSKTSAQHEDGPGAVELLGIGEEDAVPLVEPVDDLHLGDAGGAHADGPQGGEAVGEHVGLPAAPGFEERSAGHLEDVGTGLEDQPQGDPAAAAA